MARLSDLPLEIYFLIWEYFVPLKAVPNNPFLPWDSNSLRVYCSPKNRAIRLFINHPHDVILSTLDWTCATTIDTVKFLVDIMNFTKFKTVDISWLLWLCIHHEKPKLYEYIRSQKNLHDVCSSQIILYREGKAATRKNLTNFEIPHLYLLFENCNIDVARILLEMYSYRFFIHRYDNDFLISCVVDSEDLEIINLCRRKWNQTNDRLHPLWNYCLSQRNNVELLEQWWDNLSLETRNNTNYTPMLTTAKIFSMVRAKSSFSYMEPIQMIPQPCWMKTYQWWKKTLCVT